MVERRLICRALRKDFSKVGWALLVYYGIVNLTIILVTALLSFMTASFIQNHSEITYAQAMWLYEQVLVNSTWGYFLAAAVGAIILLFWKKGDFFFKTIWKTEKCMRWGNFFALLAVFISAQALYQLLTPLLQVLFGLMGISLDESIAAATGGDDSLPMFLYAGLLAPVWEEILFRGYVMRSMERYGKKFAIIASAFLFGVFHGNVVQSPYAFLVGLVLGYVAMEYSVVWAMVLHMINNLLLGDTLGRILQNLPMLVQEVAFITVIWGCAVAAVVLMIRKRKEIAAYLHNGKVHPLCLKCFFTSPGVLTLVGCILALTLLPLMLTA